MSKIAFSQNFNAEFTLAAPAVAKTQTGFNRLADLIRKLQTIHYLRRQDPRVLADIGIERYQVKDFVFGKITPPSVN